MSMQTEVFYELPPSWDAHEVQLHYPDGVSDK